MIFNVSTRLNQRFRWIALLMAFALIGGSYGWIQGVAWVGMTIKGIQQYQSISQALDKTFDGSSPCSLCVAITNHQTDSDDTSDLLSLQKQKEIPLDLKQILILPDRPHLGTLPEISGSPLYLALIPETPPPRLA